jgi:hypothetical protein
MYNNRIVHNLAFLTFSVTAVATFAEALVKHVLTLKYLF